MKLHKIILFSTLIFLSCTKEEQATGGGGTKPVVPEADPITISLTFHNSKFVWPFESPEAKELPGTMKARGAFKGVRKDLVLPASSGGYVFTVFATNGCGQHSTAGFLFGGASGDYLEFPSFHGLSLNSVTITGGTTTTTVKITTADGEEVEGGGTIPGFLAAGETQEWTLINTEKAKKYRLVAASATNVAIQKLVLNYGPKPNSPGEKKNISPLDYGLKAAPTGEIRYNVLFKAHRDACVKGVDVDYTGVGDLQITIPAGASSIPLTRNTDFKGITLTVLNNQKNIYFFQMTDPVFPVTVSGDAIDRADYSGVPELATGTHLLCVQDDSLWVAKRGGEKYDYGATRKDLFLVKNGVGSCEPCASYNTPATRVNATYREVDEEQKTFCNLNFVRDPNSSAKTFVVKFNYQNNVFCHHVDLTTTNIDETSEGDSAISFTGCTNILCEDMYINGTYSWTNMYGYGISCNGVWNATFRRIRSNTKWGVFGNNNTHDSFVDNCDIDRYDTHCYGKNITITNSRIIGRGMPCSSIFGTIRIENSMFKNCYFFAMRPDYNSYVPFEMVIKNCEYYPNSSALMSMGRMDNIINSRPELAEKCWPNVTIDGLIVHVPSSVSQMYLFFPSTQYSYSKGLGHIQKISMKDVSFVYPESKKTVPFYVSRYNTTLSNDIQMNLTNVSLGAEGDKTPVDFYYNLKSPGTPQITVVNSNVNIIK